jgi:hypothetical protein
MLVIGPINDLLVIMDKKMSFLDYLDIRVSQQKNKVRFSWELSAVAELQIPMKL